MNTRHGRYPTILLALGIALTMATPVSAQRTGFIIGFGLGPGRWSMSASGSPVSVSKTGVGLDFHLGGTVGNGLEIYWMQKATYTGSDDPSVSIIASGVGGIGFAYPVSPRFDVHGGIGLGIWLAADESGNQETSSEGLGLVGGGRMKLDESGRWMLNLDVMRGKPFPDERLSVFGLQLTLNVMSH